MLSRSQFIFRCVVALAVMFALVAAPNADAKSKNSSSSKKKGPKLAKYDKRLAKLEIKTMKKMIDQRQAALNLAKMGIKGTTGTATLDVASTVTTAAIHEYCLDYAQRMQEEKALLQANLKTWHKITYYPKKGLQWDDDVDILADVTGDEFTAALLDHLIGVHMRGIAFDKQYADKKGYHPEFRLYIKDVIALNRLEVAQIKAWIKLYEVDEEDDESED